MKKVLSKKMIFMLVVGICILSLCLRLNALKVYLFWWDEIALWHHALSGLAEGPQSAPLPSWVTLATMFLMNSTSEFPVHIQAIIFGGLAPLSIFYLVRHVFDTNTALIASFVYAISPYSIIFSIEARPYGVLFFIAPILILSFFKILYNNSKKNYLFFLFMVFVSCLTHLLLLQLVWVFVAFHSLLMIKNGNCEKVKGSLYVRIALFIISTIVVCSLGLYWCSFPDASETLKLGFSHTALHLFLLKIIKSMVIGPYSQVGLVGKITICSYWILMIVGLFSMFRNRLRMIASLLLLTMISCVLTLFAVIGHKSSWDTWVRYLTQLFPIFVLLVGGGAKYCWDFFPKYSGIIPLLIIAFLSLSHSILSSTYNDGDMIEGMRKCDIDLIEGIRKYDSDGRYKYVLLRPSVTVDGDETIRLASLYFFYSLRKLPIYFPKKCNSLKCVYAEDIHSKYKWHRVNIVNSRFNLSKIPIIGEEVKSFPAGDYLTFSRDGMEIGKVINNYLSRE